MKKISFFLPMFLSYVSTALADSELVHLELEPTPGQTASYLTVRALSDGLRVSDLTVNDGNCELKSKALQTAGNSFSNILRAYSMGQTKDAAFKKDIEILFIVACQVSNVDKVIVKTNKGIQTAQYSESAKPLISITSPNSPKKDNIFEAKFETKPLNELYQVSIYTCYQDKDEAGEVAEYCTPLLVNERKDFDLPLNHSSNPMKAREYAKRARYIEFLETFPEELPEFEKKTSARGSTATQSIPRMDSIQAYDSSLLRAVSDYEKNLIDLIKTRINKAALEKQVLVFQEDLKRTQKELSEQSRKDLRDKIYDLELRLSWKLSSLEDNMKDLSSKEKSLELFKEKVKEAKEKAAQIRLQYKNNQQ
ncbi:hypothetical protein [Haemophilus parainfluenzae]|uniref:hypothetical protein n=1 Tax=Haemophilus parainfluenzae TaxID=729 RepID=UPI002E3715FB|nr:hypothetical protein [Haemophilus parainfluenzae]